MHGFAAPDSAGLRRCAGSFLVALCLTVVAVAGRAEEAPLWTDKPVRVDRSRQSFDRIADQPSPPAQKSDAYPLKLAIEPGLKILDSASFSAKSGRYRIASLQGVAANAVCSDPTGRRWACGLQARLALRKLLVGATLYCRVADETADLTAVECRRYGKDIGESLVEGGQAFALPGSTHAETEAQARSRSVGIWADAACRKAEDAGARCTLRGD